MCEREGKISPGREVSSQINLPKFPNLSIADSHTLCSGFHCETYIDISPYHTLCSGFYCETYIGISPYHTLCSGFHCET